MAGSIITFPRRMKVHVEAEERLPREGAPGLTYEACAFWDEYTGTDAAIVAAGLVSADQIPDKGQITFLAGERFYRRGSTKTPWGEELLRIIRKSRRTVTVMKGIDRSESERRMARRREQLELERERRRGATTENLREHADVMLQMLENCLDKYAPGADVTEDGFQARFAAEGFDEAREALSDVRRWLHCVRICPAFRVLTGDLER